MNSSGIRRSRPRAGAFVALLVPLVFAAGCGDSDDGSGGGEGGEASASSSRRASDALTAARLEKLALAESDVEGFLVRKPAAAEILTQRDARTGEADCAEVSQVMWGVALGKPAATVHRRVTSEPDLGATDTEFTVSTTTVSLSSYDSADQARTAIEALSGGIAGCDGGFQTGALGTGEPGEVTEGSAPDAGEEAVAFTATLGGDTDLLGPVKAVVFRHGSTLAQFSTVSSNAAVSGGDFDFPTALVEAQDAKLG
ncbi:hypothetical protein ACFVGN_10055 [Streptomyces sp. NPDC057757]|uniref:hypothetical protein n=1 Tax=Streptomyces sp. NPDC057757 TaxID=3346241 RepID=UPI003689CE0A